MYMNIRSILRGFPKRGPNPLSLSLSVGGWGVRWGFVVVGNVGMGSVSAARQIFVCKGSSSAI